MLGTIIYAGIKGNKNSKDEFMSDLQKAGAFLIIFVSGQCVKIVGASIYTTIFRKVCSTFFKLIVMYSFLFVTFALSFHILFNAEHVHQHEGHSLDHIEHEEEETTTQFFEYEGEFNDTVTSHDKHNHTATTVLDKYKNFDNVYISLFRVVAMFAGELNSDQFQEPLKMALLLMFIFFITITLQNLMNSMAIIDTQEIISEAEIIGLKKRVLLVYKYEKFFSLIFDDCFGIFSKDKMNTYVFKPQDGKNLELYEPLSLKVRSSEKGRKKGNLTLSQNSAENIMKFFEKQRNEESERNNDLICSKCSTLLSSK